MPARPSCAAVAAGLLLGLMAGCGGSGPPSARTEVARYIQQVNSIEAALTTPLATVTQASSQLSRARTARQMASIHGALLRADVRIRALKGQLAAIAPPPAARRLRALTVALVAGQETLTRQVALLADFLPRFTTALRPLGPATLRLEAALAPNQATGTAAVAALTETKAAALDRYRLDLDTVLNHLRRLQPPAVSRPGYGAQVNTLRRMSASSGALAHALRLPGQPGVVGLFHGFDVAAAGNGSIAVQRAQIAAVRAYDQQARRLDTLVTEIQRERASLTRTLR